MMAKLRDLDTRYWILMFLSIFCLYAVTSPSFVRTPKMWMASTGTALALEFLLLRYFKNVRLFPLSGLISSLGILLLVDSPFVWPYALCAALAVLSKHFLTAYGHHIFNPNNFGLVCIVLLFPDSVTTVAGRWGGEFVGAIVLFFLGSAVSWRAGRFFLSYSFILFFLTGAAFRAWFAGLSNWTPIFAPASGAAFVLFCFYMISDPATTPKTPSRQILFGFLLAVVDGFLRYQQFKYAPFAALFVMCGLFAIFGHLRPVRNFQKRGSLETI